MTTILETEDWLEVGVAIFDVVNGERSKVVLIGEVKLCCDEDGEKATFLELPPPPLPPPPPP